MFSPRHIFKRVRPDDQLSLEIRFENISRPTFEFFILLGSSTIIATLGLFQNSAAVIIGAMIIAPLMRPLMGLALSSITADERLFKRALMTLVAGSAFGISISYAGAQLLQSIQLTPEILGRTHPTLLDLGVALAAGAVGAYCQSREDIRDSLAGVAIAVALVPPLSVVGIGLARGSWAVASGAAVLYATNLVGITVAAATVLLLMGYSPVNKAKTAIFASIAFLAFLVVPLGLSMRELVLENRLSMEINRLLKEKTHTFKNVRLQSVEVKRFKTPMDVVATVYGAESEFHPAQVKAVQDFLVKNTGMNLQFRLRVIPVTEIRAIEVTTENTIPMNPETQYPESVQSQPSAPDEPPKGETSPPSPPSVQPSPGSATENYPDTRQPEH
ncbi:MAG: TIGR00341 family protein [Candidatus Obscuribacterales bacterium]|nr:TIGR00341 family protein [Candidatus Obscuribacterales bacterium]